MHRANICELSSPWPPPLPKRLYDTDDPAPFSVIAFFDSSGKKEIWSLRVPYVLSFLYYNEAGR